jgi:hypothetical protein
MMNWNHSQIDFLYPDKSAPEYKRSRFEYDLFDLVHRQKITNVSKIQSYINFMNWLETNNHEDLDQSLIWLTESQSEVPEILVNELRIAAIQRLKNPKKKYIKSQVKAAKEDSLQQVLKLIYFCGITRDQACDMGAWYYDQKYSHLSAFISTSIYKAYSRWMKTEGARLHIIGFKKYKPNGWTIAEQKKFTDQFGQANKALRGTK